MRPLPPGPRPCHGSLTAAPSRVSSARAASMSSTTRIRLPAWPGVAFETPSPKWIEAGEPGGVNCTMR